MNQIDPQTIGAAMCALRKRKKFTRSHLSAASGVPYSSLSRAEKGECCLCILSLAACASVLSVSIDEYIGINPDNKGGMISND